MASKTFNRNQTKIRKARQAAARKTAPKVMIKYRIDISRPNIFNDSTTSTDQINRILKRL